MSVMRPETWDGVVGQCLDYLSTAPVVGVGEWQSIQNKDLPQANTIEVEDFSFKVYLPEDVNEWARRVLPNLPWAEEHFQERISGLPHNPPPSAARWPYAQQNNSQFKSEEKFSHTYPERIWPKWAAEWPHSDGLEINHGIRYDYGDLDDVIRLLRERPGTRQAYLPIWFPEDTGAVEGQRVPCTLGYHFLVRNGQLKIVYYIRSCDFYRHFRDDVYMAGRLGQYVAESVGAKPSSLVMHISSLHIFEPERQKVRAEYAEWKYIHSAPVAR